MSTAIPAAGRLLRVLVLWLGISGAAQAQLHHYVFFDRERERIHEPAFLQTPAFEGAQLKYTWRELEPEEGRYDFSALRADLAFLDSQHKRLFVQLQDVSFDPDIVLVPRYLLDDPRFHGGAAQQCEPHATDDRADSAGWVARRWDPAVQQRFHALLAALGAEFDGKLEGINLAETAVTFLPNQPPADFTPERYREAVLETLAALKQAFPKSVAMQYANFMPGEWLPEDDHGHLRAVYERARELGVAVGGPDLLPHKRGQLEHAYPLIRALAHDVPTGIAVQWGNYEHQDPRTHQRVTIPELIQFAHETLHVDYVFWCTQEPYFTSELVPFLAPPKSTER